MNVTVNFFTSSGAYAGRLIDDLDRLRAVADPGTEQFISQPRDDRLVAIFRRADGTVARGYT